MTRIFPIRLDAEIKHVPFGLMEPHQAQCILNHGKPLEDVSMQGGLTPEEAVAILEDRPYERMPMTAATLRLKQLVEAWQDDQRPMASEIEYRDGVPVMPPSPWTPTPVNLTHGRALHALELAKSMRDGRRAVYKANWNELITALEGIVEGTR